jgi:ubiquinone/menaquinone biosynthesis C-methylase UbiE
MKSYDQYFEDNRKAWDQKVDIHKVSDFYDLASFKKGESSLRNIELEELGNVAGKSLLHLQCHFGMDTISFARMGARSIGVDFSEKAIALAKELNEEEENRAQFVLSSVYDLRKNLSGQFDIVFTSYGTIGWLPDLDKWAETVAYFLKPGGVFYMVDFHPVVWMLDDEEMNSLKYSYFNQEVISMEESSYVDKEGTEGKFLTHGWNHPLSEVLTALLKQDLKLEFVHEFDYSAYDCFPNLVEIEKQKYQFKGLEGILPVMYSLKMSRE